MAEHESAAAPVPKEKKCQYTFVGKAGLRVSNIALGGLTFGEEDGVTRPGQNNEAYAHQVLDRFVEWGGNFIDTANVYASGASEEIIGSWLEAKNDRERFVIATKVRFNMDPTNPNMIGLGRRHITQAIESSLHRLRTSYVDLYQMHCWDSGVRVDETLRTMHDLQRCGKVRYMGASNVTGWQMQKLVCEADRLGLPPIATLQQQYSLLYRESEREAFQVCKTEGIGVLPWSPLKHGLLTGKFVREEVPSEGRLGWIAHKEEQGLSAEVSWKQLKGDDHVWAIIDACKNIAKAQGVTTSQVALRWLLQKDVVPSVIIGARTLKQLDDNMGAASGWSLTRAQMSELDQLSEPPPSYPHAFIDKVNVCRHNPFMPDYHVLNKF